MADGGIRDGEGGGKISTGDLVEKLKSRRKEVTGLSCSVETFGCWLSQGPMAIIYAQQGWDSLGIDLGILVYIPSLSMC